MARRAHLPAGGTTFYRAVHTTESAGQFALDVVGAVGVLSLYAPFPAAEEQALAGACAQAAKLRSVYLKRRPVEARHLANVARETLSPPEPLWGEAQEEVTGVELGVPYLLRPGADLSIGLFGDARPAREWVQRHAQGRVLNTFAYTCGFGLNAALGGAQAVKNVDLSRKVLAWGQENYALNGLPAPDSDFLYGDVFEWLSRLQRRGEAFDLVVLDPPSFARGRRGVWRSEKDYGRLVAQAAAVTAPGGGLLTLLNHAGVTASVLEHMVQAGLAGAGRVGQRTAQFGAGEDYPGASHLKVQAWRLDGVPAGD